MTYNTFAKVLRRLVSYCLLLGAISFTAHAQMAQMAQTPQTDLPMIELSAGIYQFNAQVASQPSELQTGLMWRESMPENEGMLFVFNRPGVQCFWMKNTLLPLSAAFIADDGTIVNIENMSPMTTESHCSDQPVRFVLEMHQGWFTRRGIEAGKRIQGEPFAGM